MYQTRIKKAIAILEIDCEELIKTSFHPGFTELDEKTRTIIGLAEAIKRVYHNWKGENDVDKVH